jgi:hypothetical protein
MTEVTDNLNFQNTFSPDLTDNGEDQNRRPVYSKEERAVIDKFKEKYMAATYPFQRKSIAQLEMFPQLFNYWKEEGKIYDKKETRRKSNVCSNLCSSVNLKT